jgi:hypothetical protein
LSGFSAANILMYQLLRKRNVITKGNKIMVNSQIRLSTQLLAGFNPTPFKSQNAFFPALLSIFAPHLKTMI